ncbi:MAG: hypothetical protein IPK13_07655 [Deltaproteobacteria bacterium]|nr:hypothetical protein [Deltaproteobacteria bacterium]
MGRGLLLVLLGFSPGCGILLQTVVGWSSESTERRTERLAIDVASEPSGALVKKTAGPNEPPVELGTTPLTDYVDYQAETVTESPSIAGLLIGGLLEVGGAVLVGRQATGDLESVGAVLGAGTLTYLGLQDLVIALIHGLSGDSVKARRSVDPPRPLYTASLDGRAVAERALVPDQTRVVLRFSDGRSALTVSEPAKLSGSSSDGARSVAGSLGSAGTSGSSPSIDTRSWVIAVMDVADQHAGDEARALAPGLVKSLGDQLRIFIAQRGVRTIDRGAQESVLREQVASMKNDSYKACYDDSCQIELGKALAASHILRARIVRFGARCVLNAELVDLKAEVTVTAASARGNCEEEGFLNMSEEVAKHLVR